MTGKESSGVIDVVWSVLTRRRIAGIVKTFKIKTFSVLDEKKRRKRFRLP